MECLTDGDKDRILKDHGNTVMKRIRVNPYFMAELVKEGVMDSLESQDIQAEQTPGKKRNALLAHLQGASIEVFINFCIVLEVKQERRDIVHDVFGLKLENLQRQKDHIRQGELTAVSLVSPVRKVAKVAIVHQPYDKNRGGAGIPADKIDCAPLLANKHTQAKAAPEPATKTLDFQYHEELKKGLKHMLDAAPEGQKVVVAILDTGIYTEHPRLKDHIIDSHNCFPDGDEDLHKDDANHGTLSAGIVVQYAGNCVKILNVKVTVDNDEDERCMEQYLHEGMKWIAKWEERSKRKVDIVLTSIGVAEYEYKNRDAFDETLFQLGRTKVIIAAASNDGNRDVNTVCFPASHDSVLAIGSQNAYGNTSDFSSRGEKLNFMFRGEDFTSTSRPPNSEEGHILVVEDSEYICDYVVESGGTSFAAPHCAAAIANILAYTESELGPVYRAALTNTANMKQLLIKACRQRHNSETGYGFPDLGILRGDYIKVTTRSMYNDNDWTHLEQRHHSPSTFLNKA